MPKAATYALIWSPEHGLYQLAEHGNSAALLLADDHAFWRAWLEDHTSFAFHGRAGRISLLKEARKGGAGYWYAYRRQGQRTVKHYLGRSADLTPERLEQAAAALTGAPWANSQRVGNTVVPQPQASPQPLLAPKLQPPRLPAGLVARTRLLAQLDAALERKLTLLVAPAGFGKTTLVRQWLATRSSEFKVLSSELPKLGPTQNSKLKTQQVAWLALDDGDNDPLRFWRYLIGVCQSFGGGVGQSALALLATTLQPPFEPLGHEVLLSSLLNDLARLPRPGILVLEDYHEIAEPQIHAAMSFFLDHLPATLHVVIVARSTPPLALARMRASGDLGELHAADLRFSTEETQLFLGQAITTALAPAALSQIDAQIEGWGAGLRLLALALQGRDTPHEIARVLATFAGSHRPVLDYFVAEVLSAQPPQIQEFLLRTAMLDRLTGGLCDAVLGKAEGTRQKDEATFDSSDIVDPLFLHPSSLILEELVRANLFVEPLDNESQWYRYHALFAGAMRHEARNRLGDAVLGGISATASAWYEDHGRLPEAIEAALQAHKPARAAELIERRITHPQFSYANQLFSEATEWHTLRRWLEQLPESVLRQHPLLCLNYAIALLLILMAGRSHGPTAGLVETTLRMAEDGFRASNNTAKLGEVFAFHSIIVKQRGEIDASVALARQALAYLPAEAMAWRGVSLSSIGTGEHFAGRLDVARKLQIEARAISQAIENWSFTRAINGMLSAVYIEQSELHLAAAQSRQTLAEARQQGDRDDVAHAQIILMHLSYEWNALDVAEQQAYEALTIGEQLDDLEFGAQATLMLAQIEHARGQAAAAQRRVGALLDQLQSQRGLRLRWHARAVRWMQARLQLGMGDLAAAQRWADARALDEVVIPYFQRAREDLLAARLLIAQGHAEQALDLLMRLLEAARGAGHHRFMLETLLVAVLAHSALKQLPEARQLLQQALVRAAGEGYMRLFLDEGAVLVPLLRACLPSLREPAQAAYLQSLLHAFAAGQHDPAAPAALVSEALSPQEQRVLQLLAAGRSNPEIAEQLVVSVNTVKAHLKNIYRKLGVRNRMQAARRAASGE